MGTSLSKYNFFIQNSLNIEDYETEYMFNLDPDLTDDSMLQGHAMAESQTHAQNGNDRLERFTMGEDSSENLKLIGYRVMLKPSYLAEIEFLRQNLGNLLSYYGGESSK